MTTALIIALFLIGSAIYSSSWLPIVILLALVICVGLPVAFIRGANMEDKN